VGLLLPDEGEVWVDDEKVNGMSEERLLAVRRRCGMSFNRRHSSIPYPFFDNIGFGLREGSKKTEALEREVHKQLGLVGLSRNLSSRMPSELSFGEQRGGDCADSRGGAKILAL